MKKKILLLNILLICCMKGVVCEAGKLEQLVFSGPPVPASYPLSRMQDSTQFKNIADKTKFIPWDSTDQLRAMIAAKQVDFVALTPASVAKFYNKGVQIRIVDVLYPSSLWVVSSESGIENFKDLQGEEIVLPFRPGDMPEVILSALMSGQGFVPGEDIGFKYVGSPMAAVQMMLLGRFKHAFLAEPAITMAISGSSPVQEKTGDLLLRKSINIQNEWGREYPEHPFMPLVAIAVVGNKAATPGIVKSFRKAYRASIEWCLTHPEETGKQLAPRFPGLREEAVSMNVEDTSYRLQTGTEAKGEIFFFLGMLKSREPACIGGQLPDEDIIWKPKE